ncbi:hypothetical protein HZS_7410, partial [Henneguya salminicola]
MSKRKSGEISKPIEITNVDETKISLPYNLKIVTWNVAGFKACVKNQSTLKENKSEYKYYWHVNAKPGYAGVSIVLAVFETRDGP